MTDSVQDIPVQSDGTTRQTSPTYVSVDEVAALIDEQPPSEHADEGERTKTDWQRSILWAESEVERIANQSWRPRRSELEYHGFDTMVDKQGFYRVDLNNRNVRTLDSGKGDELLIWDGDSYEDWLATKTQDRSEDYWVQEPQGFVHIKRGIFPVRLREARVKVSYRYGKGAVPDDVKLAVALLVGVELEEGERIGFAGAPDGQMDTIQLSTKGQRRLRRAHQIVGRHQAPMGGY